MPVTRQPGAPRVWGDCGVRAADSPPRTPPWDHPVAQTWRGAREAEWAGFETRRGAILRGFKSHPLRPWKAGRAWSIAPASKAVRVTPTGVQIPRLPLQHLWSVNQTGVLGPRWKRVG